MDKNDLVIGYCYFRNPAYHLFIVVSSPDESDQIAVVSITDAGRAPESLIEFRPGRGMHRFVTKPSTPYYKGAGLVCRSVLVEKINSGEYTPHSQPIVPNWIVQSIRQHLPDSEHITGNMLDWWKKNVSS